MVEFLLSTKKKDIRVSLANTGTAIIVPPCFTVRKTIPFRIPSAISAKVLFAFIGLAVTSTSTHITDNLSILRLFIACARSSMSPWFAFTASTITFM